MNTVVLHRMHIFFELGKTVVSMTNAEQQLRYRKKQLCKKEAKKCLRIFVKKPRFLMHILKDIPWIAPCPIDRVNL